MAVVNTYAQGTGQSVGNAVVTTPAVGTGSHGIAVASGYGRGKAGVPPLTPSLLAPIANAVADLSTTAFTWTFVSPQGLTQAGYALRFMAQQSTTWSWYDASTSSLVPYEVFNSSTAQTATPGIPPLANGTIWSWEVAVQDTNGLPSPYSLPFLVTGSPTPTVTPTAPTGTLTTGAQTLVWVNSNIIQMQSWQVIVYTQPQTTAGGFVAGKSPWVWTTGVTNGSASSVALPNLPTGIFYAYIQITSSLGQSSAWTSWELDYSYTQPAQPTLTGSYNSTNQTVSLTLTGHDSAPLLGNTSGSVYRSNDGGSTWTLVSTFDEVPLPSSGESATETDFTPNPSQDPGSYSTVYYYGVVIGPSGIVSPRSTTLSVTPTFPAGTSGWNFLQASGPGYNSIPEYWQPYIVEFSQTQPIRGGLHTVLGLTTQIQTYDVLGGRVLKLKAETLAETDWVSLRSMLASTYMLYVTNVYGLVGYFTVDPKGYETTQQPGSIAATIRETTFTLVEAQVVPNEGAGT